MEKKDKTPYNEKGEPHGYWEVYWGDGNIAFKGNYINGEKNGLWEHYNGDGTLFEEIFYT